MNAENAINFCGEDLKFHKNDSEQGELFYTSRREPLRVKK